MLIAELPCHGYQELRTQVRNIPGLLYGILFWFEAHCSILCFWKRWVSMNIETSARLLEVPLCPGAAATPETPGQTLDIETTRQNRNQLQKQDVRKNVIRQRKFQEVRPIGPATQDVSRLPTSCEFSLCRTFKLRLWQLARIQKAEALLACDLGFSCAAFTHSCNTIFNIAGDQMSFCGAYQNVSDQLQDGIGLPKAFRQAGVGRWTAIRMVAARLPAAVCCSRKMEMVLRQRGKPLQTTP